MDYIIIGLLVLLIIIVIISLFKNNNEANITERIGKLEVSITKDLSDFRSELNKDYSSLREKIEERLIAINNRVNDSLNENFEKTNKTFMSVLERLSKIDEAQKNIDKLSSDIVSLQSILTDKKARGIFGEINLNHILKSVFGEKSDNVYQLQYTMPNGTIADSILFAPLPLGRIVIDSKFPLENYRMMVDKNISQIEREKYEKMFKIDVKKHIDAIKEKYIIPSYTADEAIMFLPAEAIFAEINAYHPEIIDYAYKNHVFIASPTTLISTLTVIQVVIKNMERDKYAKQIHEQLRLLGIEFSRYKERWDKLSKSIDTVSKEVNDINITTDKITKRFDSLNEVEFLEKDNNKISE